MGAAVLIDEIIIRPAEFAEAGALQALIQRAYRGESATTSWSHEGDVAAGERVSRADLERLIRASNCRLSVAAAGDRIVGSSLVTSDNAGQCEIGLLSVDPDIQGAGIGDRLLRDAEGQSATHFAAAQASLEVLRHKAKLIAYYERRGYTKTDLTRPYPYPVPTPTEFLILRKDLPR